MSKMTVAALTAAIATSGDADAFDGTSLPEILPENTHTKALSAEDLADTTFGREFSLRMVEGSFQAGGVQEKEKSASTYIVKVGDTLWSIARDQLGDPQSYKELQRLNPDLDPTDMKPGTVLKLREQAKDSKNVSTNSTDTENKSSYSPAPHTERQVFNWAMKNIFGEEGGLNTDKKDLGNKGGRATNLGVTQPVYDMWRSSQGEDLQDVRKISHVEATELYHEMYWNESGCDKFASVSPGLALMHLDTAINNGVGTAVLNLQEAIATKKDGKFEDKTLEKLREANIDQVIKRCLVKRLEIASRPHLKATQPGLPGRYQSIAFLADTYQSELPPQSSAEREARKAAGLYTPSDQFISDCCDLIKEYHVDGAIKKGSDSDAVKALQRILNHHARATFLKDDGSFGPKTTAQIKAFQVEHGLKADGIVGRNTLNALIAPPSK